MKKKTGFYSLILLTAVVLTFFLVLKKKNEKTFTEKDTAFAIEKVETIGKVYMADLSNNEVRLDKLSDGSWQVNGKYIAREDQIDLLMSTLRKISVRHPVSRAAHNNIVKDMATQNTRVEIYDLDNKLIKSFLVGSPAADSKGNYMKLDKSDFLFVVQIPGFDGHLGSRFFLDEKEWRSRAIFKYDFNEIIEIKVDYAEDLSNSFVVKKIKRDSITVNPINGSAMKGYTDPRALAAYVNYYTDIHAEAFLNEYPGKDTVLATKPYVTITVKDFSGNSNDVNIYRKKVGKRTKMQIDTEGNPLEFDTERSYATINGGKDFVLIQDFVFGKLLMKYSSFFPSAR